MIPRVLLDALYSTGPVDKPLVALALDRWRSAIDALTWRAQSRPHKDLAATVAKAARAERAEGVRVV